MKNKCNICGEKEGSHKIYFSRLILFEGETEYRDWVWQCDDCHMDNIGKKMRWIIPPGFKVAEWPP